MLSAIILGILIIGAIAVTGLATGQQEKETTETTETIECSDCGDSCSLERNCGKASCGAVTGRSCGCGR
jgi:hypothetical protein